MTDLPPLRARSRTERLAYSVREAADALGVHEDTVTRAILRGELLASRVGRRVLIRRADLERLLVAGRIGGGQP